MRILIYESLPDIERSAFIRRLREYLTSLEYDVFCLVDEKTIFRLEHGQGSEGIINSSGPMCHNIIRGHQAKTFVYLPNFTKNKKQDHTSRSKFYAKTLNSVQPDRIIIWNGLAAHHVDFIETINNLAWQHRLCHMEVAWLPQKDFFYCDRKGINGNSSIATQKLSPLTSQQEARLTCALQEFRNHQVTKKQRKTILVPLQLEHDTSILHFSPFKTMQEFVSTLEQWIPEDYIVTVRPHPKNTLNTIPRLTKRHFQLNTEQHLYDALASSEIVIGINSTTLLEAMAFECTVLTFGKGVFSCLNGITADTTKKFSTQVKNTPNYSPLLYDLLFNRQIPIKSLNGIEHFLEEVPIGNYGTVQNGHPYPLWKMITGELRYHVGILLNKLGLI
ncbi:MAG: hypothetical protein ACERJ1_07325 [Halodesulfovibrio sp.]|uniref:capsular polysaccharide export protein, LipB/KpsS family n=1 Tax=Halodesulfovibrio sp. TaxID=1912772 RepID=UPI00359DC886